MVRNPSEPTTTKSWRLYEEACNVSPMGTQTHSKAPREVLRNVEPCFLERGRGCRVWDVDGNEYIDFVGASGPSRSATRILRWSRPSRPRLRKGLCSAMHTRWRCPWQGT